MKNRARTACIILQLLLWLLPVLAGIRRTNLAEESLERIGQWSGKRSGLYSITAFSPKRLVVAENYAYLALGTLQIFDVSDPQDPRWIGWMRTPGSAQALAISGDLAFVADGKGLAIVDISDRSSPRQISYAATDFLNRLANTLTVSGGYAYIGGDAFQIMDISDPGQPQAVGGYITRGPVTDAVVDGQYAYIQSSAGGFQVLDLSDPTNPVRLNPAYATIGESMALAGDYIYATGNDGRFLGNRRALLVIDVRDKGNPQVVGSVDTGATGAVLRGKLLFTGGDGLRIWDMANPAAPKQISFYEGPSGGFRALDVRASRAYTLDSRGALRVVDISNPLAPKLEGTYSRLGKAVDLAMSGQHVFLADSEAGLEVLDVGDSAEPRLRATVPGNVTRILTAGKFGYLADQGSGIQIIDLGDPVAPRRVGGYSYPNAAPKALALVGENLFFSDSPTNATQVTLIALNVRDPARPALMAGLRITNQDSSLVNASDMAVSGHYLYLAIGRAGLRIIDIEDPAKPVEAARYSRMFSPQFVAITKSFAYVGSSDTDIIDIADPLRPAFLKKLPRYAARMIIQGTTGYFLPDFEVLDIAAPLNPVVLGSKGSIGARGLVAMNGLLYVATETEGLLILGPPKPPRFGLSPRIDDTGIHLDLTAPPTDKPYEKIQSVWIERSVNLKDWTVFKTVYSSREPITNLIRDPNFEERQFYRARTQ